MLPTLTHLTWVWRTRVPSHAFHLRAPNLAHNKKSVLLWNCAKPHQRQCGIKKISRVIRGPPEGLTTVNILWLSALSVPMLFCSNYFASCILCLNNRFTSVSASIQRGFKLNGEAQLYSLNGEAHRSQWRLKIRVSGAGDAFLGSR